MDRYGLKMAGMLVSATVHRWLGGAGIPRRFHVPTLIAAVVAIDALSAYFTFELRSQLAPVAQLVKISPIRLAVLQYAILGLSSGAMLLIVFGESSASQATQLLATVRTLPVSRAFLSAARSLPTAFTLLVIAVSALPPAVTVLVVLGWSDVLGVVTGVAAAMATGAAMGLAVVAGIRAIRIAPGRGLPSTTRYPLAVCIWAATVALQVWLLQSGSSSSIGPVDWLLVWPAAAKGIDGAAAGPVAAAGLIGAAYLVLAAILYVTSPEPETAALMRKVRLRWRAAGYLPAYRMEMLRLWRTGRIRSVAAVNLLLGMLAAVALLWLPADSRKSLAALVAVTLAILWMAIPLMARGVGIWHSPVQLQLGMSPVVWALAVTASAWTFSAIVAAPALVLLALVIGDPQIITVGAFLALFGFSIASLVGFTFPAGGENTVGEVSGMVVCGISLMMAVWVVGQLIRSTITASVVMGVAGVLLAPMTGAIERTRWRVDIGSSRE